MERGVPEPGSNPASVLIPPHPETHMGVQFGYPAFQSLCEGVLGKIMRFLHPVVSHMGFWTWVPNSHPSMQLIHA